MKNKSSLARIQAPSPHVTRENEIENEPLQVVRKRGKKKKEDESALILPI